MPPQAVNSAHEPIPTSSGPLTLFDKISLVLTLSINIPIAVTTLVFRRLFSYSGIPLKDDLLRSIMRGQPGIPVPVLRKLLAPNTLDETLNSPRFSTYKNSLCEEVRREQFCGWWINKGWGEVPVPPKQTDVVILYLHGGGYILGHPLGNVAQQLRVAESLAAKGISTSTFAAKYTLTPEAKFPQQYQEALQAYKYLLHEMEIDPSRIVVWGESAGGHLALALSYAIAEARLPRPGAAYLVAPWVDLTNSDATVTANKNRDSLSTPRLDLSVGHLVGSPIDFQKFGHVVNFAAPQRPGLPLSDFLPHLIWVTAGSDEIFLGSIESFVSKARAAGVEVELEVAEGKSHAWQSFGDALDRTKYLQLDPGSPIGDLMPGAGNIASGMLEVARRLTKKAKSL